MKSIDFTSIFDNLIVCKVRNWDEVRVKGRFVRYSKSDYKEYEVVQSKWIYAIDVPCKTQVIIGLHQEDERTEGVLPKRPYIDAGLALLKMDKS